MSRILRGITDALVKELKKILREYVHETELVLKKRLQRLLVTGIVIGILTSLVITLLGSASLFLEIGSLKYLSTFMPEWKAWEIMGLTSGVVGGALFLVLFIVVRRQLRSL